MNDRHYPAGTEKGGQFAPKNGTQTEKTIAAVKKYSDTPKEDLESMGIDINKTSIKEQVRQNLDKIRNTEILANIPKEKFSEDFQDAVVKLKTELNKSGGVVTRKGFGEIQVSSRLKSAGAYIKNATEVAALSVVPIIIEKGIEIGGHNDHKERGYPSYTFAGQVSIGGKKGIVAVVVKKTTQNFYKAHRVLTPDGETLDIEKDAD